MKIFTRNIWLLSFVSMFTDIASEMLYPVMPVYLKSIGFSIVLIGVLEGVAEATAGLSKGYFGKMSDRIGKRLPFVQAGYGLSAFSKPLLAFFSYPLWVFGVRTMDRLGKGVRTGARDALLSDEATPATKGRVFGLHRAMDTLGAVIGPLLALFYLQVHPAAYTTLFYFAFFPGIAAILFTFLIKEKQQTIAITTAKPVFFDFIRYWKTSSVTYRKLTIALLVFTLFNSSDVFLLLKMKDSGFSDTTVIGIYIFYNLVFATFSLPLGFLADKIGMKKVMFIGLLCFGAAYTGMAYAATGTAYIALFFLYGLYAAATDGIAKAWITNISEKGSTATAIGNYTAFQSIASLFASILAGAIWYTYGAPAIFILSGMIAILTAMYILTIKN